MRKLLGVMPGARSGRRTTGNKYLKRSAAASKLHITSTLESVQGGQEQAKPVLASKASARRRQANTDLQLEEKARYRQPSPGKSATIVLHSTVGKIVSTAIPGF